MYYGVVLDLPILSAEGDKPVLLEFSVANYRSIKERVTLSLVASKDSAHEENTFPAEGTSDFSLLKSVAIYGANASGKSNLLNALSFMRRFVLTSASEGQRGDTIPVVPFKLDPETAKQPSEFELALMLDGERYVYGFTADREKVHEEWLTAARKKPRVLFRRSSDGDIYFGPSWRGTRRKLASMTRPNALFLSVAVQFDNPTAEPVFDWLTESIKPVSEQPESESEMAFTTHMFAKGDEFAGHIARFMKVADIGIDRFTLEQVSLLTRLQERLLELPEEARKQILSIIPQEARERYVHDVKSFHTSTDGSEIVFDLRRDESAGTIRLFALAGPFLHVLKEGCVLVVDEIASRLHPRLTRFLIKEIHRANTESQLIFTTHDSSLLDSELFRRDQIWFTEKDPSGATDLYSLWDYKKTRKDENFRTGYLQGRYGAIPFVGELAFDEAEE